MHNELHLANILIRCIVRMIYIIFYMTVEFNSAKIIPLRLYSTATSHCGQDGKTIGRPAISAKMSHQHNVGFMLDNRLRRLPTIVSNVLCLLRSPFGDRCSWTRHIPANTGHSPNAASMLGHLMVLQCWVSVHSPNGASMLGQRQIW